MAQIQSSTELTTHGGDEGRRSQDVVGVAAYIWGMTDGYESGGFIGAGGGLMELSDITGNRDLGDAAATSV